MDDRLIGLSFLFIGFYGAIHHVSFANFLVLIGMIYFIVGEWRIRWSNFLRRKN